MQWNVDDSYIAALVHHNSDTGGDSMLVRVRRLLAIGLVGVALMALVAISAQTYLGYPSGTFDNYLENGGFETPGATGIFANWAQLNPSFITGSADAHSGDLSAQITWSGGAGAALSQAVAVTPGEHLRLTFWTKGDGDASGRFDVYDVTHSASIIGNNSTGHSGTTWKLISTDFDVPAGCTSIYVRFWFNYIIGSAKFDDVRLYDPSVPDPITWVELTDVLTFPPPTWERGLPGYYVLDLVADTGILTFSLDNGPSNSQRQPGLYSPDSLFLVSGIHDGSPIRVMLTAELPTGTQVRPAFVGRIAGIRPTAGASDYPETEIEAYDWMGYLSSQELGVFPITYTGTFDSAIQTALQHMPIPPAATDFGVGTETFLRVFDSDDPQSSMASFFQKMARNEWGHIWLGASGTLRLDNQDAWQSVPLSFALTGTMSQMDIGYERTDIANIVKLRMYPAELATGSATRLWDLNGAPAIEPGQTLVFECPFTDPSTGGSVSALDVINPVVAPYVEFGSAPDFTSNDLAAYLQQDNTVGGNSMTARLTNIGSVTGYLNDFQPHGNPLYVYSQIVLEARDDESIAAGVGERRLEFNLEQVTDVAVAEERAAAVLARTSASRPRARSFIFLANQSPELASAALNAEIGQKFVAIERATGIIRAFFVHRLRYTLRDSSLWVEILGVPVGLKGSGAIWDFSLWDNTSPGEVYV